MKDIIFREYDIRGKVGQELIIEEVYALGNAIIAYFKKQNPAITTVVIGMDGRTHSPHIEQELSRALVDSGLTVIFIGLCPSPVLYFALKTLQADAGLMVTASHNPKEYNGIKICLGSRVVWGEQIKEIGALYKQKVSTITPRKGTVEEKEIIPDYIAYLASQFAHLRGMPEHFIIDCGNGASGAVIPLLCQAMDWKNARILYPDVDGTFPHHEADPVVPENMAEIKQLLHTTDALFGIGLDGDADRMAPMTKNGYLVPGDKVLALFAQEVLRTFPGAAIVFDIKSSQVLIDLLEQWGARPCIAPSGHAIIRDYMTKTGALLGGELSCHFFFSDRYFGYDDGIYALMRLIEIIVQSKMSLDTLIERMPSLISTPEIRIPCAEQDKQAIINEVKKQFVLRTDVTMITIDGVRATADYGWGIARASNTQPVICLRFESTTYDGLHKIEEDFMQALAPYYSRDYLKAFFEQRA